MTKEETLRLREIIAGSKRIVFFGGAGVSTASGIPDFRSAGGLYSQEFEGLSPETVLSSTFFYLHPELFFDFYRKHMLFPSARPNAAHCYLAELEKRDVLRGIVTQNIDGLHKDAGNMTGCIRTPEISGYMSCMDLYGITPVWNAVLPSRSSQSSHQMEFPVVIAAGSSNPASFCMESRWKNMW